jgi:hypothetical protein
MKGSDTVEFRALHSAAFADLVVDAGEDKTVLLATVVATVGDGQGLYGLRPTWEPRVQVESVSQDDASK